ncbi:AAA-type ATPase [Natrialba magadii ATCC 43099]|uniref:AAA-type ATPase n=2 Tax=Natrialba magadii (strain ATCC 43099 / DSM 3394 / CCM 3739 / CIP 104546 / IAM 13178 / JCM 8861 / NBRC 102185 / NCIMB 2190 / MS3) TaxID=547559 RepID=D3SZK6_NATMM|nr:AAA family ATPase [Natrialba magadii]ADD04340.1 AAA-type ATPase [Natrialba magadii ATCC 43099]
MPYYDTLEHLLEECELANARLEAFHERATSRFARDGLSMDEADGVGEPVASAATFEYALPERDRDRFRERRDRIERKCNAAHEQGVELRLRNLVDTFDLQPPHRDVLVVALLPDLDPGVTDSMTGLTDERSTTRPTVGLCADLFADSPAAFASAVRLLFDESPLVEATLVTLERPDDPSASILDAVVAVKDRIRSYLLGSDGVDSALQTHLERETRIRDQPLTIADADASLEDLLIAPECRADLEALPDPDGRGRRVYVHGPEGAGMHRAVEAVCESDRLLRADLRAVLAADALDAVVREARLLGLPLVLHHADQAAADADQSLEAIVHRVGDLETDLYVVGRESWTPSNRRDRTLDAIQSFSRPTIAQRREFWADRADQFAADIDPERLASTFDLTQGQLEAALTTARTLAADGGPTVDDIRAGCRAQSSDALEDLAQHVEPDLSWDDIKLGDETRRQLETLEAHVTNRGRIYDDWGFRDRDKNAGVVALFKGLPGTGKTMAAEVLAKEVGMDVYKIDLSSVVSKYIGETEENLEEIFQAAEQSNAILLFDEADSIFGDRAEVSDATDRYANVEVNYLLQRIEHYDGIIVLTTNYAQNIDTAFSRRITHTIRFEKPDAATRRAIWESIFPPSMPVENIDTEWLADFEYSGGTIDKLAKHIAIYAAEADAETITMRHVVEALEQYKRDRNSRIQDRDFEPYLEYLQGPTEREQQQQRHRIRHDEN